MKIYVLLEEDCPQMGTSKPVGAYSDLEKAKANKPKTRRSYVETFDLDQPASKPVTVCIE